MLRSYTGLVAAVFGSTDKDYFHSVHSSTGQGHPRTRQMQCGHFPHDCLLVLSSQVEHSVELKDCPPSKTEMFLVSLLDETLYLGNLTWLCLQSIEMARKLESRKYRTSQSLVKRRQVHIRETLTVVMDVSQQP